MSNSNNVDIQAIINAANAKAQENLKARATAAINSGSLPSGSTSNLYGKIDNTFINTFIRNAGKFFDDQAKAYDNLTYSAALNRDGKNARINTWNSLSYQAGIIKNFILENKGSLDWNQDWEDLLAYTSSFDKKARDMNASFDEKYDYFDQFENENDYNWTQKYKGNSSDDLRTMMEGLEDGDEKTWLDNYAQQVYFSELPGLDLKKAKSKVVYLENLLDVYRKIPLFTDDPSQKNIIASVESFGGEDGLLRAISREKRRINEATWIQENEANAKKFGGVTELPDFAEKSAYNPEITDLGYRYINADLGGRIDLEQQYGTYVSEMGYRSFDALSDEEKSIYNYYMNTGDRQSAADYLKYIRAPLNKRKGDATAKAFADLAASDHTILGVELPDWWRYAYGGVAGLDQFRSGMEGFGDMIAGREGYKAPSAIQYAAAGIREDLADEGKKLPEWMGGGTWGQAAFDTITTSANMAPSILMSTVVGLVNPTAGAWVGRGMMGAGAAGSGYRDMLNQGYSVEQARTYGALVGSAEIILEALLGKAGNIGANSAIGKQIVKWAGNLDSALANFAVRTVGQGFSEALEEGLQEHFDTWLKRQITREDFQYDTAEEIYSSLLGFMTGMLFEGPNAAIDIGTRIGQGQQVRNADGADALVKLGRESSDADVQAAAKWADKHRSAYNLGKLKQSVETDIHSQNAADISASLVAKGMDKKSADQTADAMARILEDGSEADIRLLATETDPIIGKTMREVQMKGTPLYQRMQTYRGATGTGRNLSQVAAQYGDKANAIKAAYEEGQDVEDFAHGVERVFTHGKEGGKQELLDQVAPDMSAQQRMSIYMIGRDAAAQEKAAAAKRYTGEAPVARVLNEDGSVGEAVRIEEVTSKEGGQWTYKTSDGQVLTDDQLSFSGDHAVLDTVKALDLDAKTASVMISGNNTISQPDAAVAQGIEDAYRYGSHGYSMDRLLKDSEAAGILTEEMRQAAYDAGKNKPGKAKPSKAKTKTRGTKPGVYFDNGNGQVQAYDLKSTKQLKDTQKAGVHTAVVLQRLGIGTDFYFFESYVKDGKRVYRDEKGVERPAPNGWYDPSDGSIHIDLNAGNSGQGLTLYTMAHELTHFIEQRSQEKYKVLADFLIRNYEKDRSVDELVQLKQEELNQGRDKPVSYEEAYSEVIADSMEAMLSDGNVLEKLAELKAEDEGLVRKMKAFFDRFVKKIRSIYAELKPESAEGQLVLEMKDQFEQLQQLFAEALADAGENYRNAAEVGMEVDVDTESVAPMVQMSERTWRESDYVQARNEAAREISKAIGVTEAKAKSYIDDVNSIARMIAEDRTRLDYFSSPGRSSFIGNVEYGGSFDFSTLCKKRRLLTGTFTAIQKALPNTALTANEILDIRNRMKKAGLEVSCGLCYVEGSRANMGQFAQEFLKLYRQYYPDAWQPNMADVNTPEGIEWVRINHPECYEQYEYFWNHYGTLKPGDKNLFASQQKPKLYQLHTEYNGEILQKFKNDDNVEDKNLNGGIRLQSFSDFEIVHLIDTMQIIMDMSRVGLAGQAYTKVPDFAWALGDTGLKINLSLIAKGVDESGNLIFDDIEGMPIGVAMDLRDRYSANVGTILVAFNDAQLIAAMADDRVDFIIPFHRSQWKKSQYEAMGLPAKTNDYTYMQNEKFINPQYHEYRGRMARDKATNYMPNEYWDFSKTGKENAEAYLQMCARNNKRPKFYKLLQNNGDGSYSLKADGSTDGYWKLLIDFKMYDNAGNGSPQTPVRPEFNMDEATRMLNDYRGGHSNFPVAQGIVDDFVSEYKETHAKRQYQDRASAPITNRALLANALESTTQDETELTRLREYRMSIDYLNEQEAKLTELRRQIRDISFGKGPRDTVKLKQLQEEATKTATRINEADKKLLRLEAAKPLQRVLERERRQAVENVKIKDTAALKRYKDETASAYNSQKSDTKIMEREFIRLMRDYEKATAKAQKSAKKSQKEYQKDISLMEKEFVRLMKAHENDIKKVSRETNAFWEREFGSLLREYDTAGRSIERLEAKIDAQRASAKRNVDSRRRTVLRNKIRKDIRELNQILNHGNKKRNVKQGMQEFVSRAIAFGEILFAEQPSDIELIKNGILTDTTRDERRLIIDVTEYLKQRPEYENNPNMGNIIQETDEWLKKAIKQLAPVFERERIRINSTPASVAFDNLIKAYKSLEDSEDPYIAMAFDTTVLGYLENIQKTITDTLVKDMSQEQLQELHNAYKMVLTTIRNANRSFNDAKNQTIAQLSTAVVREIRAVGGGHKMRAAILDPVRKFFWNNLKPVYAFEAIGSGTLQEAFNSVRKGEDVWAVDVSEARKFYLEKAKKYGYNSWDFKKKYRFESESGQTFELTLEQILSLYAYSRRAQAHEHLRLGGFVFDSSIETKKEKGILTYKVNTAEAHQIDPETLTEIIGTLSKDQIAFVEDMQGYLSETMGAKGNEVTMQMYGVKLFREKNYFPLKSAKQFMFEQNEVSGEVKLKNSGFTNKLVPGANNPVILNNFMDVWASHVNDMSMYHAFVLPLEDLNRIFNYNSPQKENIPSVSVKGTIQSAYTPAAVNYVKQLITDLNGGARTDSTTDIPNKLMGMFKKGAVFASASVVIQQPSAVARAAAVMDLKWFVGGKIDRKSHAKLWEEVKQYAPVAVIKEMGYFDTNMGKSSVDYITGREYDGFWEKSKATITDSDYRDELLSRAPALADEMAWCAIWNAVKRETRSKNPGMDTKSDIFLRKAGDRFTEVIIKTQVYDSVLARSANMRSEDTGMKMATAFMAEPTTSINMIADALLKGKRGQKRMGAKAIGAVVASQILNAFLVAWVYAGRDDDEEKTYWEKYAKSFVSSLIDGINPATYLPFIKDIVSIAQGYDVERSDMAVISDLWNAWKQLEKDDVSAWRKVEGFVGSICQIFGLPLKNIMRDVRAIWQTYDTFVNGESGTDTGMKYAIAEGVTGGAVSNPMQLYYARRDGDTEHAARVAGRYDDEDSADAAVRSAIRELYLEGELDLATARNHLVAYGGMDVDDAHWQIDEWKYLKEHGNDADYGKYNDFYAAVESGENLEAVIKTYTDNGVELKTLTSQLTEHFKPLYVKMSDAEREAFDQKLGETLMLLGYNQREADSILWKWEFKAQYGFDWEDRKKLYINGEVSESEMRTILSTAGDLTQSEIDKEIQNWEFEKKYGFAWSDKKQAYLDGEISAAELANLLVKYGEDYDAQTAKYQVEAYDWQAAGYEGASANAVEKYYTWCKPAGVSRDTYMKIRDIANNTENDKDAEGKSINYSAVKKIMVEINRLPVSSQQKEAIALSLWKESTVKKYKLW